MTGGDDRAAFERFVNEVEPGLRRALAGHLPVAAVPDALSEAFAYAWEHWDSVAALDNPGGYLFRVAQSRSRCRRTGVPEGPDPSRLPDVEPRLGQLVRSLPDRQRSVVWLVHACGWTSVEAAAALDISPSAVATHLSRAMTTLRNGLGVGIDG